jgi:hypothetical protein
MHATGWIRVAANKERRADVVAPRTTRRDGRLMKAAELLAYRHSLCGGAADLACRGVAIDRLDVEHARIRTRARASGTIERNSY